MRLLHELLNKRYTRMGLLLVLDMAIIAASYFVSFWLRIDLLENRVHATFDNYYYFKTVPFLLSIRILCNILFKLYHWSFSHAGINEGMKLAASTILGTGVFIMCGHVFKLLGYPPPRSVYVLEAALTLLGMFTLRFFPGYLLLVSAQRVHLHAIKNHEALRTAIYGDSGRTVMLMQELLRTHGHGCAVIGLLDDNPAHMNSSINGIRILGGMDNLSSIIKQNDIEQILLAGEEITGQKMRELVNMCGPRRVKLKRIPDYSRLLNSPKTSRSLEDIDPEYLLDRQPVDFTSINMTEFLFGKTVLVTGAGGTIGSELCRQAAQCGAKCLLLFDINENALSSLYSELLESYPDCSTELLIGSIRDRNRLDAVMSRYKPEILFHAAAHKHVPILENAPGEAIKNNVLGTYEVADCACLHGVKRFIFISSDKAVSRANVLGLSKRLAELVVRELNHRDQTKFQIVRFGNVLDSNGSLVEIVRRQISKGGPVTITHPDMERYFMTIHEAVGLVLVAAALDEGEINVLDMGELIKVDTLVHQMIYLAGLIPGQDIDVLYTKPRPGEQLREILFRQGETICDSSFSRIKIVCDAEDVDVSAMLKDAYSVTSSGRENALNQFFFKWVH